MTALCAEREKPVADPRMVEAVLREIAGLLETFSATGEAAAIDLGGLPFSPRAREALDARLGRGEIEAAFDVAGRSEIWETGFSGVWRVRHFGAADIIVDLVEITSIPEILRSDRRDAKLAAQRLKEALGQDNADLAEDAHEQ